MVYMVSIVSFSGPTQLSVACSIKKKTGIICHVGREKQPGTQLGNKANLVHT